MEQYIKKSDLVAEIEKRKKSCTKQREDYLKIQCYTLADDALTKIGELNRIQELLNTLEVKEVDLDEEIRKEIDKYYDECEKKLSKMKDDDTDMSFLQLDSFAKHFFELGLKAQKGINQ